MKEKEKVEIITRQIKKIVILDRIEFSLEDFFKRVELMAATGQPIALNWAEGIVFLCAPYHPNSDMIIEETLKGTIYWAGVMYAPMPDYQPIKKFGARGIPILDQTSLPHFRQVAEWLKKSEEQ